ncbi:MAG TPA: hypothetical protein IAB32_05695 [Candidatus Scatosoma pullicola]|nr:hypothetical protein [Candidatus Scatosoma pullicola]
MAKEQKGMNGATEQVAEMRNGNFVIRREAILDKRGNQYVTSDGRLYFKYKLHGNLRGRKVVVDFSPKDKGGYLPLDLVFDVNPEAELDITDEVTEFNGRKQHRTVYTVNTVDENGVVWHCEVKPTGKSDVDLLTMLMNMVNMPVKPVEVTPETAA